ncbi:MAG: hypothetical protein ACJ748_05200 [Flavisolibacter sp.]
MVTIKSYYKNFKSIYGIIAGVVSSLPVISFVPENFSSFLFPPLGNFEVIGKVLTLIILALVTLLIYVLKDYLETKSNKEKKILLLRLFVIMIISYLCFLLSHTSFVYEFHDYAADKSIPVSVGYQLSPHLVDSLKNKSFSEILQIIGPADEQIKYAWTMTSLNIARLLLLVTYMTFFIAGIAISSIGVLLDLINKNSK